MKTIFVIIIAGLLVGCSTDHPDSRISEINLTLPERWSASKEAQAGVDTNWIYQVGGQNGERIVKEALQSNPQLSVAAERVQQAAALTRTAKAQRLPSVAAGVDAARTKRIFVGFPFGGGGIPSSDFETFTSNFSVSWEPDIWGFKKAGQEALIANAQAEEQAYSAAKASLAAQVLRSWFAIAEANEQLVLVSEADQLYRTTLELVRERYEMALVDDGGAVAQLRIAESEVATNQERTAQYQGIRDQAIRQLETLLGRYPEGGLNGLLRLPKTPPSPPAHAPGTARRPAAPPQAPHPDSRAPDASPPRHASPIPTAPASPQTRAGTPRATPPARPSAARVADEACTPHPHRECRSSAHGKPRSPAPSTSPAPATGAPQRPHSLQAA